MIALRRERKGWLIAAGEGDRLRVPPVFVIEEGKKGDAERYVKGGGRKGVRG
jgi:hypothetical protein